MATDNMPTAWIDGNPWNWFDDGDPVVEPNELIKITEDTFHIGQSYENRPAKIVECARCGGREFNVAKSSCYTAIKCIKCQWEICTHEG